MRRKEKEITEKSAMEAIIKKSIVCRLGLSDGNIPYIVPLCFGYKDGILYFHGALKGKKTDIIKKNQNVCFEFDITTEITKSDDSCRWGMKYQSVIGFGKAVLLDDVDEKQQALDIIMGQYSDEGFKFPEKAAKQTAVIKVEINKMTGKQSG